MLIEFTLASISNIGLIIWRDVEKIKSEVFFLCVKKKFIGSFCLEALKIKTKNYPLKIAFENFNLAQIFMHMLNCLECCVMTPHLSEANKW